MIGPISRSIIGQTVRGIGRSFGSITRFIIDLFTSTCDRNTTRTVRALPVDGVVADGLSLITVEIDEQAITSGRRISEGVWSDKDADGVSLTNSLSVADAGLNKCECVKANPTDLTGVNNLTTGTLSVVDDITELSKVGFDGVCNGNVYKLALPSGVAEGFVTINGVTTNINQHSFSIGIRTVGDGLTQVSLGGGEGIVPVTMNADYTLLTSENFTPGDASRTIRIRSTSGTGTDVYFILPQLEESPISTPTIIGADTAASASRDADINTIPTPSVLTPQNGAFEVLIDPALVGQNNNIPISFDDSTTSLILITTGNVRLFNTTGNSGTFAYILTPGTYMRIQVYWDDVIGFGCRAADEGDYINAVAFSTNAAIANQSLGATLSIGHKVGGSVFQGEYANNGQPIAYASAQAAGWV